MRLRILLATLALAVSTAAGAASSTPLLDKAPEAGGMMNDITKYEKDGPPIARNYEQQPPLIPHQIKNYNVTKNFNKCMDCHSWSRAKEFNATKVSQTHFKDREGHELKNISPRRYFCMQCHVPQADAKPLVTNSYQGVPKQ